jgi:hypothetical protein
MSERQKQNEFVRELMRSHDSADCRALQAQIVEAERNEKCICRAIGLAVVLALGSLAGLAYSAVFLREFFEPATPRTVHILTALLITSGICLVGFIGFWVWYRAVCNSLYTHARKLIMASHNSARSTSAAPAAGSDTSADLPSAQFLAVPLLKTLP